MDIEMGTTISESHCNNEESAGAVDTWRGYYSGFREGFLEMVLPPVRLDGPVSYQAEGGRVCIPARGTGTYKGTKVCSVGGGKRKFPGSEWGCLCRDTSQEAGQRSPDTTRNGSK